METLTQIRLPGLSPIGRKQFTQQSHGRDQKSRVAAGWLKYFAIPHRNVPFNPRTEFSHYVIHQPSGCAVCAELYPRGSVNQRTLVKKGQRLSANGSTITKPADVMACGYQRFAPPLTANWNRSWGFAVVVFCKPCKDIFHLRKI